MEREQKNSDGHIVSEDSVSEVKTFTAIPKEDFYKHKAVQDIVPKGVDKTQVHVRCMKCGFETVFGVRALIQERTGRPKLSESCKECGENVWEEVQRKSSPCDWTDEFGWADPPEGKI